MRTTPAWSVYSWPPLLWQSDRDPGWHLVHLGTRVLSHGDGKQPCAGQTVWGAECEKGTAGVAWDWIGICPGVVALADPLGLITNLQLVDEQGQALPTLRAAMQLNELVHNLPWQTEVQRALEQGRMN